MTYDDRQGTELVINHLLAAGRKHIAYVGGPERHQATRTRREATDHALTVVGLTLRPADVLIGEWSEAWGRAAAALLAKRPRGQHVDGVFCASDQIARGVVDGMREAGIAVPEETSVVGFDNWDVMAEASRPPLTTVEFGVSGGSSCGSPLKPPMRGNVRHPVHPTQVPHFHGCSCLERLVSRRLRRRW